MRVVWRGCNDKKMSPVNGVCFVSPANTSVVRFIVADVDLLPFTEEI